MVILICSFLIVIPVNAQIKYYSKQQTQVKINDTINRNKLVYTGLSLINKTKYRSKAGSNKVFTLGNNPKYLCCSSFVSWCFYKSGIAKIDYSTWNFCHSSKFKQIKKSQLKIGDIGLIQNKYKAGNHVGIYVGKTKNGNMIWLHCTGHTGNGVTLNNDNRFKVFYRYKNFK